MLVGAPFERLSLNITGPYPSNKGNMFIVKKTMVDHFSKWAEACPVHNNGAETIARVLLENLVVRYGTPVQLLTDLGTKLQGKIMTDLCHFLEINKIRTTRYRPYTNACAKRFHKSLNSIIAKLVAEDQRN